MLWISSGIIFHGNMNEASVWDSVKWPTSISKIFFDVVTLMSCKQCDISWLCIFQSTSSQSELNYCTVLIRKYFILFIIIKNKVKHIPYIHIYIFLVLVPDLERKKLLNMLDCLKHKGELLRSWLLSVSSDNASTNPTILKGTMRQ